MDIQVDNAHGNFRASPAMVDSELADALGSPTSMRSDLLVTELRNKLTERTGINYDDVSGLVELLIMLADTSS